MWKWVFWKPNNSQKRLLKRVLGNRGSKNVKKYWKIINPSVILWTCLKYFFGNAAGPQSVTFQIINSTTSNFQLICLPFQNTCFKGKLKEKSNNFEMQCIVCYSRYIALHFQLLQLVRLTDRWSNFFAARMNRLMGQHLLSSAINKKEMEIWKVQCGSTQWKVLYIVYERNMEITIWACWFQNKLVYVIALVVIYTFLRF